MVRGSTSLLAGVVGYDGEVIIDTDKKTATVHDGETPGGFPLLREDGDGSAVTVAGRTLSTRVGDVQNVLDAPYGAKGDGTNATANATAFGAALSAAAGGLMGGTIELPAGDYRCGAALTITVPAYKTLVLRGAGGGASTLTFTGATNGLTVTLGKNASFIHEGVTYARGAATPAIDKTAVTVAGPTNGTDRAGMVRFRDVTARGNTARTTAWLVAFDLRNLSSPTIDHCTISLPDGTGSTTGGDGISLSGASSSSFLVDAKLTTNVIQGGYRAVHIHGYVQGVYSVNHNYVGCDYGFAWDDPGKYGQLLTIGAGHIAARTRGIYSTGGSQAIIGGTLFLKQNDDAENWAAIHLVDCLNSTVAGNTIYGNIVGTETGIIIDHTTAPNGEQPSMVGPNNIAAINGPGVALLGHTVNTSVKNNSVNGVLGGAVDNTANPTRNFVFGNDGNATGGADGFDIKDVGGVLTTAKPMAIKASNSGVAGAAWQAGTGTTLAGVATLASYGGNVVVAQTTRTGDGGAFLFSGFSADGADCEYRVDNDGNVHADGTYSSPAADYAEWFQWDPDHIPEIGEDRRGVVVVAEGDMVRPATAGDPDGAIIGVVSAVASVIGNSAELAWRHKHLKDLFGATRMEAYQVAEWEPAPGTIMSVALDAIPDGVTIPPDAAVMELRRPVLNPEYDPTRTYVPPSKRPEWVVIGLVGRLRVWDGQPVRPGRSPVESHTVRCLREPVAHGGQPASRVPAAHGPGGARARAARQGDVPAETPATRDVPAETPGAGARSVPAGTPGRSRPG